MNYIVLIIVAFLFFSCKSDDDLNSDIVQKRKHEIDRVLASDYPLLIPSNLFRYQSMVDEVKNSNKSRHLFYSNKNEKILNELMSVSPLRESEIAEYPICKNGGCFRLEIYNYAKNWTANVIYDDHSKRIIDLIQYKGMQPEIPEHLAQLAVEIARNDSMVIYGFGCQPGIDESRMEATKTTLNRSTCQRSEHLCVAPTFVLEDKALWAIVDLTDLKVVGVRWTDVGYTGPALTERVVQNKTMMDCYCNQHQTLQLNDWKVTYQLTRSDGLEVKDIYYRNKKLYESIKVVDWHVSYSETEQFGYSDAIGCPEFSHSAVLAVNPPLISHIIVSGDTVGFSIQQDYFSDGWPTPCSYNYRQKFEFYSNGDMRPAIASLGRGCGTDGWYRPVTRIAFAGDLQSYKYWKNENWEENNYEHWKKEKEGDIYNKNNVISRVVTTDSLQFNIVANRGQWSDNSRGDLAFTYLTRSKKNEGQRDLPTIGPCCNIDHRQGPEKFIDSPAENISGHTPVLWYVPELKNDGRPGKEYCWAESVVVNGRIETKVYPCYSGPRINLERT